MAQDREGFTAEDETTRSAFRTRTSSAPTKLQEEVPIVVSAHLAAAGSSLERRPAIRLANLRWLYEVKPRRHPAEVRLWSVLVKQFERSLSTSIEMVKV